MSFVVPASSVLWYFFSDKEYLKRYLGTPRDTMEKFSILNEKKAINDGLELFLLPEKIDNVDEFKPWFYRKFSKLKYKTVHIADSDDNFLHDIERASNKLLLLSKILQELEVDKIILHAHYLKSNQKQIAGFIGSVLPGVTIYVENNGAEGLYGSRIEDLTEIMDNCKEFNICLDICHLKDVKGCTLDDFVASELLKSRIAEIHFSYSTYIDGQNSNVSKKSINYNPNHALWSVVGKIPSKKTMEFVRQFPVVLEGVIPVEDRELEFLNREQKIFEG